MIISCCIYNSDSIPLPQYLDIHVQTCIWQRHPHNLKCSWGGDKVLYPFLNWPDPTSYTLEFTTDYLICCCQGARLGQHILHGVHQQKLLGICHLFFSHSWGKILNSIIQKNIKERTISLVHVILFCLFYWKVFYFRVWWRLVMFVVPHF